MTNINESLNQQLVGRLIPVPAQKTGFAQIDGMPFSYTITGKLKDSKFARVEKVVGSRLLAREISGIPTDADNVLNFQDLWGLCIFADP